MRIIQTGVLIMMAFTQDLTAFQAIEAYAPGMQVEGFEVLSVYLDVEGKGLGARYRHPNGMLVDVLRFASVPQVSLNFNTLPISDRGESHTLEHLVLGKGPNGTLMNSLMTMSMADHTASTHSELTNYQFNTAGDVETFYRLLERYLAALIHPNFSDEEIRREVAHIGVELSAKDGSLYLEEKGSVYTEMVSSMEKAGSVNWNQFKRLAFGEGNPMANNSGGDPAWIRKTEPSHIRAYHESNYHFGSNLELIAALPGNYDPHRFLAELQTIMAKVEPAAVTALPGCLPAKEKGETRCHTYTVLPTFEPVEGSPIAIGTFPSDNPNLPQSVYLFWKPRPLVNTPDQKLRLELLLEVVGGGETSLLYQDLIDEARRTVDCRATGVGSWFYDHPAGVPMILLSGLPTDKVEQRTLETVRGIVRERFAALGKAPDKSPAVLEVNTKALSQLSSWRRLLLKFIDSPPRFGFRGTGVSWHQHLRDLQPLEGFRKPVIMTEAYDRLQTELEAGKNVWREVVERHGLSETPVVSAVVPDKAMLEQQRQDKQERLKKALEEELRRSAKKDAQQALAAFAARFEQAGAAIEARNAAVERPGFLPDPPLTLDETIDWQRRTLAGTVDTVLAKFPSTPFTEVSLFFDLNGLHETDELYLPVLPALLTALGVRLADGTLLDYAATEERWRSEIYRLDAGFSSNGRTGRLELQLQAGAAGTRELAAMLEWLRTTLVRYRLDPDILPRLRTVLREQLQDLRQLFQQREEYWVNGAAAAYRYQHQPAYLAVESPFTRQHHLTRLWLRLAGSGKKGAPARVRELLAAVRESIAKTADRTVVTTLLQSPEGPAEGDEALRRDVIDYLQAELAHLPEETWREDVLALLGELEHDLGAEPEAELKRLRTLLDQVQKRASARMAVTGSPENLDRVLPMLEALLLELAPAKSRAKPQAARTREVVLERLKGRYHDLAARPAHVGLINPSATTGVFVMHAPGPLYDATDDAALLDFLAAMVFSGAAPHSFFLKTWAAGLAYSNGIRASAASGALSYYAERCPDLTATMRFVTELARNTALQDRSFVDTALANSFADYRGAETFSKRGLALALDLVDGRPPRVVKSFKQRLLALAQQPETLARLEERLPRVLGSVLVGYGSRMEDRGGIGYVIGPEGILRDYEIMLQTSGEAQRLIRLYPRDFWVLGKP